jgi:hypothetical protein
MRRYREPEELELKPRALVLQTDGFDFLIDTRDLWKPPRVLVRRGVREAEVWLWDDDVEFMKPTTFLEEDEARILALVEIHCDELLMWWAELRNDVRRGRLERNVLVD